MALSPVRQKLLDILRTQYADTLAKVSDILDFVAAANADSRAALMGDALCWWNLVPMDRARAQTAHLPFTKRSRIEAAQKLEGLLERRELNPDDAFEQNLPPDAVGALVIAQLELARAHGPLVQFELFQLITSGPYVPYVGHVTVRDDMPITTTEMAEAAAAHTDELSVLEAMYQNPNAYSVLAAWAVGLAARTDERTAKLLIGYAIGRLMMLTRMAIEHAMGAGGGMPVMIRLGSPGEGGPPDGGDGTGGIDPKKAN